MQADLQSCGGTRVSSDTTRQQDLSVLHPVIRDQVARIQQKLDQEKLPFKVFEAFRTPERQRFLYRQGRDMPGDRVTKAQPWGSYHQYGLAVDFVLYVNGNWSWNDKGQYAKMWPRLHAIGREHGLEPLSWEAPHLQYAGTTIDQLQAGEYPAGGDKAWAEHVAEAIAGWTGSQRPPPVPKEGIFRPPIKDGFEDEGDGQFYGSLSNPKFDLLKARPDIGLTSEVIRGAQSSDRLWGVPASVTLAQFILESGYGKRMPPGSNNPFGIKARGDQPFVEAATVEHVEGHDRVEIARFRKYTDFDEAFSHHGKLLATSAYYRKAMAVREDPFAFANALTGIYATDPKYGAKLVKLIRQYELTDYDINISSGQIARADIPVPIVQDDGLVLPGGLKFGDHGEAVRALQQMLKACGYSVGAVDGEFGTLTRAALLAFQADNALATTGVADEQTAMQLNKAPMRPLDRKRVSATEEDLDKRGSKTIMEAKRTKLLGWVTGILGAVGIGNSAVVNSAGPSAAVAPGLESFLDRLQIFLTNPASSANVAQLNELRQNATAIIDAVRAFKGSDLPSVIQRLEPLLTGSVPAPAQQNLRTVFDLITPIPGGSPNIEILSQTIASIAASFVPGFGGSVASLVIGLVAHYLGSKSSQARVQEHREGSNLNR